MPRKMRVPKARRGDRRDVSAALYALLVWGDFSHAMSIAERQRSNPWELFDSNSGPHEDAWLLIECEAVAEWAATYPGTRPPSWWRWSAPELRRVDGPFNAVAGVNRCQETGVPYGSPTDQTHLPMVESTAAYLDRHTLWLPGERSRVPMKDFESQEFTWALTVAPSGAPDSDDQEPAS